MKYCWNSWKANSEHAPEALAEVDPEDTTPS
jgi:hypothetical protein